MPVMAIARLHVMMIVVDVLLADHVPEFIRVNLPVMMIVMDHIRVTITINLRHTILVVVSEGGCVCGQHQCRCTEESKHLFHTLLGGAAFELFNALAA